MGECVCGGGGESGERLKGQGRGAPAVEVRLEAIPYRGSAGNNTALSPPAASPPSISLHDVLPEERQHRGVSLRLPRVGHKDLCPAKGEEGKGVCACGRARVCVCGCVCVWGGACGCVCERRRRGGCSH